VIAEPPGIALPVPVPEAFEKNSTVFAILAAAIPASAVLLLLSDFNRSPAVKADPADIWTSVPVVPCTPVTGVPDVMPTRFGLLPMLLDVVNTGRLVAPDPLPSPKR
jgi:hypothetical protein